MRLPCGSDDKNIKIWECDTGRLIRTLKGHDDYVNSVCFSSDGKYIASGSDDTTVIIWSAESGERLTTLWTWDHDDWLTITPDRYYDGNTGGIEHLGFMDNNCIYPADEFAQWFHKPEMIKKALSCE